MSMELGMHVELTIPSNFVFISKVTTWKGAELEVTKGQPLILPYLFDLLKIYQVKYMLEVHEQADREDTNNFHMKVTKDLQMTLM